MSDEMPGKNRPVLVVGAGFSGLSAAMHLARAGFSVEVREASSRPGGLIQTLETPFGLVETAANGILNSPAVEDLFSIANLEQAPVLREARARFIFRNGRARRWPLTILETFRAFVGVFRILLTKSALPREFETIQQWGVRVLSKNVSRYGLETALQGIYAGDPSRMSVTLILGAMLRRRREKRGASRPLKHRGTISAPRGMGQLIDSLKLAAEKAGVRVHLNSPVTPEEMAALHHPVVVSSGSVAAAQLLKVVDPERAAALSRIEHLPLVTATFQFPLNSSSLRGFGCLFPPGEARVLGVLLNNSIFPGRAEKTLSETWIMGGAIFSALEKRAITDLADQELVSIVLEQRKKLMGIDTHPIDMVITRWPKALPHFTVDMEREASRFRPNRNNVYLLGNFTGGIGLSKIVDQAVALPEEIARSGQWK